MASLFARQLGGSRHHAPSIIFMAVHVMLMAAVLCFYFSPRVALRSLIHFTGVRQLRGMPCTLRLRVGLELRELLLGQGPRSVGEPLCESRQFHVPCGPPLIVSYTVLILRGDGVGIKYHVLDVAPQAVVPAGRAA